LDCFLEFIKPIEVKDAAHTASFSKNPFQGVELVPGIRKVRMAIEAKGKGKSGGARVITLTYYVSEESGKVHFLIIYDKSDADTVDDKVVKHYVEELGFDLTVKHEKGLLKLRNIEQGGGSSE
jgi:hypothetical protein